MTYPELLTDKPFTRHVDGGQRMASPLLMLNRGGSQQEFAELFWGSWWSAAWGLAYVFDAL